MLVLTCFPVKLKMKKKQEIKKKDEMRIMKYFDVIELYFRALFP